MKTLNQISKQIEKTIKEIRIKNNITDSLIRKICINNNVSEKQIRLICGCDIYITKKNGW